jgi:hypothetical protein
MQHKVVDPVVVPGDTEEPVTLPWLRPEPGELKALRNPLSFPSTSPSSVIEVKGELVDVYGDNGINVDGVGILRAVQTPLGKVAVVQTSARLGDNNGAGTPRHGHLDFKREQAPHRSLAQLSQDSEFLETATTAFTEVVKAYEDMGYRVVMTGNQVFDSDASLASRQRALMDGFRTHEGHRAFGGRARVDFMVFDSSGRPASAPLLVPALAGTTVVTQDGRAPNPRNDFGIFASAHHPEFVTRSGHGGREHGYNSNLIAVGNPSPQIDPQWALNQIAAGSLGAPPMGASSPLIRKAQLQVDWLAKTTDDPGLAKTIDTAAPEGIAITGRYTPEFDTVVRAINDYFGVPPSQRTDGEMGAPFVNILNASIARVHSNPQNFHVANAEIRSFVGSFGLHGDGGVAVAASDATPSSQSGGGFALRNVEITENFRQALERLVEGGLGANTRIGWGENHPDFDMNSLRSIMKQIADGRGFQDSFVDAAARNRDPEFTLSDQIALQRIQEEIGVNSSGDVDPPTAAAFLEIMSER